MAHLSDSELAFRLQMEEAISASLSSRPSDPPPRSPSPIVHRCGVAIVVNDDQRSSRVQPAGNQGGDLGASLSSRSSSAPRRSPSPVFHRCGVAIVFNEDQRSSRVQPVGNQGGDLRERPNGGGRNEKPNGKGIIYEKSTGVPGDDRITTGKNGIYRNFSGSSNAGKPSPAIPLPQGFVRQADSSGEGCSVSKFKDNLLYRLYFKGLVREQTGDDKNPAMLAGFGVAICDMADNLCFEMKGPLHNADRNRQAAEIRALMVGLEEAIGLGIKHIAIYCDYYPIYQYLSGRWMPKQKKIALFMDYLHSLRLELTSTKPVLATRNDIKFAFKLARDAIVCQTRTSEGTISAKAARKETCVICFDDTDAEHMFSVDKCLHRYCFSCVNQYVEVKLLHGIIPKCPHDGCKSVLSIDSCGKILTPKLVVMWKRRIREDSIPVTDKVYCPYPKCSALMSKAELSGSSEGLLSVRPHSSGVRRCIECHGHFCINCKVPWHDNLSCADYKKLHPDPPADAKLKSLASLHKWRQCLKCHHMIELSQGCYHITCRCGYQFCYNCGSEWDVKANRCKSSCPLWNENHLLRGNAANYAGLFDDNDDDDDDDYDGGHDDYEYDMADYLILGYLNRNPYVPVLDLNDDPFNSPERWFYGIEEGIVEEEEDWDNRLEEGIVEEEEDWDSRHEEGIPEEEEEWDNRHEEGIPEEEEDLDCLEEGIPEEGEDWDNRLEEGTPEEGEDWDNRLEEGIPGEGEDWDNRLEEGIDGFPEEEEDWDNHQEEVPLAHAGNPPGSMTVHAPENVMGDGYFDDEDYRLEEEAYPDPSGGTTPPAVHFDETGGFGRMEYDDFWPTDYHFSEAWDPRDSDADWW
ncbi:PREDICTED: uncharacterized protein LOC104810839 [Tarenaya hassleriana]|uniref:uncharacterized protein LOC104810839 n=1 Tax=Tarenaya hassleriana TaxID=28532 RepID=UPI00053C8E97|nr:PREDICTED: uncharacterized protein LOC104810839 [Tarenaya hassleriana]